MLAVLATAGTPLDAPPTEILSAPMTRCAATSKLPEDRMPASPALTVPAGAIKYTLPKDADASVCKVPIPLPVTTPAKSTTVLPLASVRTKGGGAEVAVLEPLPASISPMVDQVKISPPATVNILDCATSTLPLLKILILPPFTVNMPNTEGESS